MGRRGRESGFVPHAPQPSRYLIRVRGHLDDRSPDWHHGLTVTREEGGDTVLSVRVADQAALHGLLTKLRDLGVPLVSINPVRPGPDDGSSEEEER